MSCQIVSWFMVLPFGFEVGRDSVARRFGTMSRSRDLGVAQKGEAE
jgi:hypothetical protein